MRKISEFFLAIKERIFPSVSTDTLIAQYLQNQDWKIILRLRKRHDALSKLLHRYYVNKQGKDEQHFHEKALLLKCLEYVVASLSTVRLVSFAQ